MRLKVDTRRISDWNSFHNVFAETFGFPEWYGRNMHVWIDCMASLDYPDDGLSELKCQLSDVVVLHLEHADTFASVVPVIFQALLDCAAFVNWRRIEGGQQAILALSYYK